MDNPLIALLRDRRLWLGTGPVVLILFIALNLAIARQSAHLEELRLKNLTSDDVVRPDASAEVRHDRTYGSDTRSVMGAIPDATKCRLVVLTGMSQMFSINDRQPGDQTISEEMDDRLRTRGTRVFGLAAPNLCNEEALFLLLSTLNDPKTKSAAFIFGACFDKFRNVDLRPGYEEWLKEDEAFRERWRRTAEEHREAFPLAADKMMRTLASLDRNAGAAQASEDRVETHIQDWTAAIVPAVADRKSLNSQTLLRLYALRNDVFRIKSSSKRPMIRSRFEVNQQFFELLADTCQRNGVQFISYVIPFNGQAEHPYILPEYEEFKVWFEATCEKRNVPHANFENLVPEEEWGFWMGGPDFKHFRGAAHRRVARTLIDTFHEWLLPAPAGSRP